jgi:hypothetical protein
VTARRLNTVTKANPADPPTPTKESTMSMAHEEQYEEMLDGDGTPPADDTADGATPDADLDPAAAGEDADGTT